MPEIQQVLAKYLQIVGHIRDQIIRGDLQPGTEVPSERELVATWKVARPTATKVRGNLRIQGFVESRQDSGTYMLRQHAVPRARVRYDRARGLGTMYSDAELVESLAAEVVAGQAHVVEALRLPADSAVVRRAGSSPS